jgi:release factor glutamine methyltransferase
MMNSKSLYQEIISRIVLNDSRDEIESIAGVILSDVFGITRNMVMSGIMIPWQRQDEAILQDVITRVNREEPVQYIVGTTPFFGRRFFVDRSVLIPRPETEELVAYVLDYARANGAACRVLDIGTGSGCIPVTLAAELPNSEVVATDISEEALAVARKNALLHKVPVRLLLHDVLSKPLPFQDLDIVVSNPPYIPASEVHQMRRNVVDYEPHLALFVPDNDPLLFYREIAMKSLNPLRTGGALFFEAHELHADELAEELEDWGYADVTVYADMSGKHRVVKAHKNHHE